MSDPTPPATDPTQALIDKRNKIREALIANVPMREIARNLHASFRDIAKIRHEVRISNGGLVQNKKDLPGKLYEIATIALAAITPAKLAAASAPQLVTTAAIAIDKARLMEGLSTENMDIRAVVPRIQEQLEESARAHKDVIEMIRSRAGTYTPVTPA